MGIRQQLIREVIRSYLGIGVRGLNLITKLRNLYDSINVVIVQTSLLQVRSKPHIFLLQSHKSIIKISNSFFPESL